jgi:hypothetical protein
MKRIVEFEIPVYMCGLQKVKHAVHISDINIYNREIVSGDRNV